MAPDVDGLRLRVGVTDAPEDGRANHAVCALIAKSLGVAISQVTVTQGATSRQKTLRVLGEPQTLVSRLAKICETLPGAEA